MNRRNFILSAGMALGASSMLGAILNKRTSKMPVVFIGHGSPMNAIADNPFTKALNGVAKKVETPSAILCISAHWITQGTYFQGSEKPKTIHDFGGFPEALFDVQYPAPGIPNLAHELAHGGLGTFTEDWGLDHGTWSVLRHIYPDAKIPVFQMSIDWNLNFEQFYELGKKLDFLRERGVLIVGSGNIVHNLRQIKWEDNAKPFDWAIEFDNLVAKSLENRNYKELVDVIKKDPSLMKAAHPSYDHYVPLLYTLGAGGEKDELQTVFTEIQNGSISMRTIILG
jgi:4,5-DOPA dioxygenase extradiol